MNSWLRGPAACLLLSALTVVPKAIAGAPQQMELFEKRVRPVLAESCQECHGPKKQEAGLRLDSPQALLKGSDNGPVIIPGDPESSPLIRAVRQTGLIKMPPRGKLKPEAVEALVAWVKAGAPWQQPSSAIISDADASKWHWSFQPVRKPPLPDVKERGWAVTSIDRFILAKLEAKGLRPSKPVDRRTLIRRATFDLTGLPPTPEEIAAFEADRSSEAFAKVVDRLLASPHYGERWGRYWLDVARYADTKGYVLFIDADYPWAWTYRDYVVRAFNDDLPYDQFLLEQLAADLLPLKDRRPLTAMGFLTAGNRFKGNPQDILDDRIDVVTRGLLGLTVSCARCHDHKFDPISQRDYYSLYGVFASSVEPSVPPLFEEPPRTEAYAAFEKEHQAREKRLADFINAKYAEMVSSGRQQVAEYLLAAHQAGSEKGNAETIVVLPEAGGLSPTMVTRWQAYLALTRRTHHPVMAPWHEFAALPEKDFAAKAHEVSAKLLQSNSARPINPLVAGAFARRPPQSLAEVAQVYDELLDAADKAWQMAREQAGSSPPVALEQPFLEELRQVLYGPDAPPNVPLSQLDILAVIQDRPSQTKLEELRKAVFEWRTKVGAPPRAMALEELPTPYQPRVFLRGNPHNLGEAVPRQFLAVLTGKDRQPFQKGSGRLELARAIADRNNPLTARVLVNRLWLHHFGQGLVRTPSDFGVRGEPPSHPELLDYLATVFVEGGWSIKKMHRLIMLSAVYQQQSDDREDGYRLDPENQLLWKMNRTRLDFEATRDSLLAVSGRLDRAIGGPPVKDLLSPQSTRRTIYGFLDRLNVPGLYRTFDFPNPDATSPQRDVTTTAPQALFLLNNPFVLESARALVQRPDVVVEKDLARRVDRLYRLLYGRSARPEEVKLARQYLAGEKDNPAPWERYAQALLLANEFVFVD